MTPQHSEVEGLVEEIKTRIWRAYNNREATRLDDALDDALNTLITTIIANIGRELEARCEGEKPNYIEHQEDCLIRYNKKKGCNCGAKQNNSATDAIDRTLTLIRSITGISPTS